MIRLILGLSILALPLIEIALLIETGQRIGFWATMAIIVATGMIGVMVLARQRFTVVNRMLQAVNDGKPPMAPVLDGAFVFLAGALLLSPGLIGDAAGLLLLIPPIRRWFARWSVGRLMQGAGVHVRVWGQDGKPSARDRADLGPGPVIEGDFERLGETTADPRRRDIEKRS